MPEVQDLDLHRIVTTAIIYRGDQYLLLKRSPKKKVYPGKWTVPGGGLVRDDYLATPKTTSDGWYYPMVGSLQREIQEEAGIEVKNLQFLLDMTFIRPDDVAVLVLSYYGEYVRGQVTLDEDSVEFAWVTYEEAKTYDLIDGIVQEIKMVEALRHGVDPATVKFAA